MEEPEMIPFSRYVINCFHGTPAKPKLPGQNTEHCEQTVDASLGFKSAGSQGDFFLILYIILLGLAARSS